VAKPLGSYKILSSMSMNGPSRPTAVKHRESLDKQDKRDVAQSVFAQDRDGRLPPHLTFLRAQTLEQEGDDEVAAEQSAINTNAFRLALVDDLIANDEKISLREIKLY
jgi:hypothetical protein